MFTPIPDYAGFVWFRQLLASPAMLERQRFAIARWLAYHLRPADVAPCLYLAR